ncbi:FAD-binding oxidoreductase [Gryllotalpicola protaetiae]|uniref:FAD-binding oxidoreductase n=1 Tax=Gryllotalpicola protaetiae TaxID=2419771 RepID=A0A387BN90_9MICO|nr:FAD-binding oxidoreductase [Gryllotalpicola protaetiae]AYG03494.1 FAD-binding oxidoreductase [Gryllotalpicola protaetiae]
MSDHLTSVRPAALDRSLCDGRIWLPGDPGYDERRLGWQLAAELRPAAIVFPHTVDEVIAVVRAAVAAGLRIAPQSTGHGAASLAEQDLSSTVIVRLSEFTGVTIDAAAATARVVGGTLWQDVIEAAAPFGFTALHGSAGDVAVAGFALSGGVSFYGREHGLAANSVRAVELVTASGELLRASADENAGLFWAVRGGGGNLGVVTAVEIELLPIADIYAGMLLWDRSHASDVLRAWRDWAADAPEQVTTSFRVISFPPLPQLPPFLAGRDLVIIDGAVHTDNTDAERILAPLRALEPELDTFARIPAPALTAVHMDPPEPAGAVSDHRVLSTLSDDAVAALLDLVGPGTRSGLFMAELRQLGGALGRRPADGGAVASIEGEFALLALAMTPVPEAVAPGLLAARRLCAALEPWALPAQLLTFSETLGDGSVLFGSARERLAYESLQVDPRGVFQANHPIR